MQGAYSRVNREKCTWK